MKLTCFQYRFECLQTLKKYGLTRLFDLRHIAGKIRGCICVSLFRNITKFFRRWEKIIQGGATCLCCHR